MVLGTVCRCYCVDSSAFWMIVKGWIGYMPPIEDLQNPKNKFATEIYSPDMKVIGTFFAEKENRVQVGFNDISPHVINALIATEDVRFYEHSGIDGWALARVFCSRADCSAKGGRRQHNYAATFQTTLFAYGFQYF